MSEFDFSGTRRRTLLATASTVGVELAFPDEPWMADAVCPSVDPELWYPDKGGSTAVARSICQTCPVKKECLQYALDHDERFGVWGGLSERSRRSLQRAKKRGNAA